MNSFEQLITQRIQAALSCFDPDTAMPSPNPAQPCTILIPIFNGLVPLLRCLDSVLQFVDTRHAIVLSDDCSTDAEVAIALTALAQQHKHVRYLRRERNLGYLENVNAALSELPGDVVLLNSDTEVGPEFIERLQRAAYCRQKIAAACPVSDNATLLTLTSCEWLAQFSTQQIQRAVASCARATIPSLPTAVGFCMYLRRDALAELGTFDRFFSPGYGEEDDFSQRARAAGWELVAATDVFVRHIGGISFGREARVLKLQHAHAARLAWRWPNYESDVRTWWRDWPLREHAERVREVLAQQIKPASVRKPHILHVLHRLTRIGGTENVARALVDALDANATHTIVAVDPVPGVWSDAVESRLPGGGRLLMFNSANVQANHKIAALPADLSDPALERSFARLLRGAKFDLVHVHHLVGWNSLLLPSIARALKVPVVLGLHCHYALCPDPEMVHRPDQQPCLKLRATDDAECSACIGFHRQPRLGGTLLPISTYLGARSAFWQRLLSDCAALIAPTNYLAARIGANFPEINARTRVIAHGMSAIELRSASAAAAARSGAGKRALAVGFLGGDGPHKGYGLIKTLASQTQHLPIEYIAFGIGAPDPNLPKNLRQNPAFTPNARTRHLIGLDLILLPSMMAETFSLVLSEAFAFAIPVIASDRGAFIERIEHGVDGWRLDVRSVEPWIELLAEFCTDAGRMKLRAVRQSILQKPNLDWDTQAQQYWQVYQEVWRVQSTQAQLNAPDISCVSGDPASARIQKARPVGPVLHPLEWVKTRVSRAGPQVLAIARNHWAQSQYRVQLPLEALHASGKIERPAIWYSAYDALPQIEEVIQIDPDTVMFLHGLDEASLALMQALKVLVQRPRLVFLLDDLIIAKNIKRGDLQHVELVQALRSALAICDLCICTTPTLASAIASELDLPNEKITSVPNALPVEPWAQLAATRNFENAATNARLENPNSTRLRVLWAGAAQHQADVDLLLPVVMATKLKYQWVFFGLCPTGLAGDAQIEFHNAVEFADYPHRLAALQADIAVAPLVDTEFNRCKSPLKLLEYGVLAIPVVASSLTPYESAPILRATGPDQWLKALAVLDCSARRAEFGKTLKLWINNNHALSAESIQHLWMKSIF